MQDDTIPTGLCQCGCGDNTRLATNTRRALGVTKGQPQRFIKGHHRRKSFANYRVEDRGYKTPCWVWQGALHTNGYARTGERGKRDFAHRVYYRRAYGEIPEGLQIDHLCRVRACVNPEHLEPVTMRENTRRGATTKLTHEDVCVIRQRLAAGESNTRIAADFGVSQPTICHINRGLTWVGT